MEISDAEAVAQVRAGDARAFRVLVDRHSRNVFRLAFRMIGNEQDAEDVAQETFLRAWRQMRNFDARASFGTWVYRIATNCALDILRSRRRRGEHLPTDSEQKNDELMRIPAHAPGPDRLAFSGELEQRLSAALAELSAMERAAFVLRHHEGLRAEEIGAILGVNPNAAKHSVFRAVQKLRHALEPAVRSAV